MVMLYDAYGREIRQTAVRTPLEQGQYYAQTVTSRSYAGNGLTATGLTSILREADDGQPQRLQDLFDDMEDRDTHLMDVLQKRYLTVIGRGVRVMPAESGAQAKKVAEFCQSLISEIPSFEDALLELLKAIYRGYSALEIVWDFSTETRVTELRTWEPQFFIPDMKSPKSLLLLSERSPAQGEALEPGRWLQHRFKAKSGLPVRAGLGRVLSWYFLFKQYSFKDWLDFAELFGTPARIGYYSPNIAPEDRIVLERAVRLFSRDLAALLPEGAKIEFPQAKSGTASVDLYERMIKLCNAEQSKAVLGQTLTSESGDKGARSLGEVHERVELRLARFDARSLAATIRRDLLLPAVRFQFGDVEVPTVEIDIDDLEELSGRLKALTEMGLPVPSAYLYQRFGVPAPVEGEAVVGGPAAPVARLAGRAAFARLEAGKKKACERWMSYL